MKKDIIKGVILALVGTFLTYRSDKSLGLDVFYNKTNEDYIKMFFINFIVYVLLMSIINYIGKKYREYKNKKMRIE